LNQRAYRRRHTEKETTSNKQAPFHVEQFRILEVSRPDLTVTEGKKTSKPRPSGLSKRSNNPGASQKDPGLSNNSHVSISNSSQAFATVPLDPLMDHLLSAALGTDLATESEILSRQSNPNTAVVSEFKNSGPIPITHRSPTALDALFPYLDKINLTPLTQSSLLADDYFHISPDEPPFCLAVDSVSPKSPGKSEHSEATSTPNCFPLSSDHLLHFIHQNVYRALISNKSFLNVAASLIKVELDIVLPPSQNSATVSQ
jgi:hypothetical protein